jgi:hypothetical protein
VTGTAGRGLDPAGLAEAWAAGLSAAAACLNDVAVIGVRYANEVQAALATGAGRGSTFEEVAAQLLAAHASYLRRLSQVPRIAALRLCDAAAQASATRPG